MFDKQWFLDEQWLVRLKGFRQLFGHRLMESTVEVKTCIKAEGFDSLQPLNARF
jgi:hypothetical protein